MINTNKLRGRIVEKYGTLGKFAEVMGVTKQTVTNKLKHKKFSSNDIIKWASALDIPKEEIGLYFFAF